MHRRVRDVARYENRSARYENGSARYENRSVRYENERKAAWMTRDT